MSLSPKVSQEVASFTCVFKGRTTRNSYQSNGETMIDKNGDVWTCIVCGKIAADAKTKVCLTNFDHTFKLYPNRQT